MPPSIAIVGLACVYPDARTPGELWENVLAQRRAFRRLPAERMRAEDYWSPDVAAQDRSYSIEGAVIEGYEFDRVGFRVAGSTFRSADLVHWLALDVASRALANAGFPEGTGLPRETTGVLLGNTLTGEFSRANVLRLRWPYVRRVVESILSKEQWPAKSQTAFIDRIEAEYKANFAAVGEESLAGGLSNTIAGRICNQFDFRGGGYTVDGACASSLLAVANACAALSTGDLDLALAGGVDLSLDPFEIVGFAKTGALAPEEMHVYDRRSAGFWPGEGCGFVVLMRHEDALAQGRRVYALVRGWGISSDGSGGITRPEAQGQLEALRRAYRRAGFGIDTVSLCEGHGTGTAVGDATELTVLSRARCEANPGAPAAAVGSIKANIGHTKAAAGVAGLIKAVMAVHTQVLPPTTGCDQPHPQLSSPGAVLRVLREPELWPSGSPLRACVSAMGFGGINAHVVIESPLAERRHSISARERLLSQSNQDAELFLFAAPGVEDLRDQVQSILKLAERISRCELIDLAAQLERSLKPGPVRAALVASRPTELAQRLERLDGWLGSLEQSEFKTTEGVFLGTRQAPPRLAFLFPGQGSPMHLDGGLWRRRFECVRALYDQAELPSETDSVSTRIMQPAIVTASLAGLRVLEEFGIKAEAAIGHSLGELVAVHWAGALEEQTLLGIARVRGAAMAELGASTGAMLAVAAPAAQVQGLLENEPLSIVGFNSPRQTVVAGEASAIHKLAKRAMAAGLQTTGLPVSHAFHTPLVAAAVPVLAERLSCESFAPLQNRVFSTVTGAQLDTLEDLRALFCGQVTSPVRFADALQRLLRLEKPDVRTDSPQAVPDLLLEVGSGSVLTGLVRDTANIPVVGLDAGGPSLTGLLQALGAAFVLGAALKHARLFADRFTRPFSLDWKPKFFVNPCELAPLTAVKQAGDGDLTKLISHGGNRNGNGDGSGHSHMDGGEHEAESKAALLAPGKKREGAKLPVLELVRRLVAERAELPETAVHDDHRMLSDLHLNSITVSQLVSQAARQLGLARLVGSTEFANASVLEMARALEELKCSSSAGHAKENRRQPPGVDVWIERFAVEWMEARSLVRRTGAGQRPRSSRRAGNWQVFAAADDSLVKDLRGKLSNIATDGVVLWLPETPSEDHLELFFEAAGAVRAIAAQPRFVVVQHGWGGGGFARTLHLETEGLVTCIVNVPRDHPKVVEWIIAEATAAKSFSEVRYDDEGRRYEPRLKWLPTQDVSERPWPIGGGDVLLVTGGGKGIAAECALGLGRATGASVALLGRSDPAADKELSENIARIRAAGVRCCYVRADVTDGPGVCNAVARVEQSLGPITAVLHGAGTNTPRLIESLDLQAFRATLVPKTAGLANVLAAFDPNRLRLLITFSSIIARAGLRGEADYATANEWLTACTEKFQKQHPSCRCLAIEWSVWSGVGMGERLGRVDSLIQQGIMPISPDEGVRMLLELVKRPSAAVAQIVTGRFGEPPTLRLHEPELPLCRFLERRRVYYPGVELIVDADLSREADLYLDDHILQKQRLFPAVLGLEAMAQAAMALAGSSRPPSFEKVEFNRPVSVPDKGSTTIRLAALRRGQGIFEVCLRSEETDYHIDHFRALCRFQGAGSNGVDRLSLPNSGAEFLELNLEEHLYGRLLFHGRRFRRLCGYRWLNAVECAAEIGPGENTRWFGPYLPENFVLGDPAVRDAALHAIQACIPHQRILPTGVDRAWIGPAKPGVRVVQARQRERDGNSFVYDMEVTSPEGEILEHWEGLRLRAVEPIASPEAWPLPLLAPYLGRRLEELAGSYSIRVMLENNGGKDRSDGSASRRAAGRNHSPQRVLGHTDRIWRRPDGKPVIGNGNGISASHSHGLTLAVGGSGDVACDLERVVARSSAAWHDLLGKERSLLADRVSRECAEEADTARTRLWTAIECLKKAGLPLEAPLLLDSVTEDGWVVLRSGRLTIATCATAVCGSDKRIIVGVALSSRDETEISPAVPAGI